MADYTKKLRDDIALLKEQKNLLEASAEHTKRYGFEVSKGKTRLEEFHTRKNEEVAKLEKNSLVNLQEISKQHENAKRNADRLIENL